MLAGGQDGLTAPALGAWLFPESQGGGGQRVESCLGQPLWTSGMLLTARTHSLPWNGALSSCSLAALKDDLGRPLATQVGLGGLMGKFCLWRMIL